MRTGITLLPVLALAACLPTKTEPYRCTTDTECLTQVGVEHGLRCDLELQVCVCDGLGAPGCEKWIDAGPADGPTPGPIDAGGSDVALCTSGASCPTATPICSASGTCTPCTTVSQCAALGDPARATCSPTGSCVECLDGSTCPSGKPLCDPSTRRCVECLTPATCPSAAPVCTSGTCTGCSAAAPCAALNDPTRTLCAPTGACVGCLSSATCPPGMPVCAPATGTCTPCAASAQCAALDPGRPACGASGACVQCTDNSTCAGATSVCDVASGKCVQCLSSTSCPTSAPICSTSHSCGSCASGAECAAKDPAHPACSTAGTCVECVDGATCPAGAPVCDTAANRCVQCLAGTDCPTATPICGIGTNKCVPCATAAECKSAHPARPACAASGACVECTDNSTCPGSKPVCDTAANKCVQCLTSNHCSGTTPICSASQTCVGCTSPGQCASVDAALSACAASGACVQCTDNSTCSGATPVCNPTTNRCRACAGDSECGGVGPGVCMAHEDGRCASDGETVIVSTDGTLPTSIPAGKRLLVVRGAVSGSVAWNLGTTKMTIVGQNQASIAATGSVATIHLSGGDTYLRNLMITGGSPGLWADAGAIVRLDHVSVSNNTAGGILLDGAGFDIKNTTVEGNGSNVSGSAVFGGIRIQNAGISPKSVASSTLVENQLIGITCDAPSAVSPAPTSVLVVPPNGAVDIANCGFTSCGTASATCGAQP